MLNHFGKCPHSHTFALIDQKDFGTWLDKFETFVEENGENINKGVDLNLATLRHWMLLNAGSNLAELDTVVI